MLLLIVKALVCLSNISCLCEHNLTVINKKSMKKSEMNAQQLTHSLAHAFVMCFNLHCYEEIHVSQTDSSG
jgi:hypothetical protein